jgi:hypothetical protein
MNSSTWPSITLNGTSPWYDGDWFNQRVYQVRKETWLVNSPFTTSCFCQEQFSHSPAVSSFPFLPGMVPTSGSMECIFWIACKHRKSCEPNMTSKKSTYNYWTKSTTSNPKPSPLWIHCNLAPRQFHRWECLSLIHNKWLDVEGFHFIPCYINFMMYSFLCKFIENEELLGWLNPINATSVSNASCNLVSLILA